MSFVLGMQNAKASKSWPSMREWKNHSASQPQLAFYFSVTLQSISPFLAVLSTRGMFSHSTEVVRYPKNPNHKQSNSSPFRFFSPPWAYMYEGVHHQEHQVNSMQFCSEKVTVKTDTGLVTSYCFLYGTHLAGQALYSANHQPCEHSKNQTGAKYKKSKVKYNLANMNTLLDFV